MSFTIPDFAAVRADVERTAKAALGRKAAREPIGNPLLDLWSAAPGQSRDPWDYGSDIAAGMAVRDPGHEWFSWAVPDDGALDLIAKHSPGGVVEVGAGTGYWARMLADRGVDVVAYDLHPFRCGCGARDWCSDGRNGTKAQWFDVQRGGPDSAAAHPDRTLLLCWPPYGSPMAAQAVAAYHDAGGRTVAYVGEGEGGCTGDDDLYRLFGGAPWCTECEHIESCDGCEDDADDHDHDPTSHPSPLFRQVDHALIPVWAGLHDSLAIYEREVAR